MKDRGEFDWVFAVMALIVFAAVAAAIWAATDSDGTDDRIEHCLERGGTARLDEGDRYDGCLIGPGE